MQSIIARLKQMGKIHTAENYSCTLKSFMQFRGDRDVLLSEIDSSPIRTSFGKSNCAASCAKRVPTTAICGSLNTTAIGLRLWLYVRKAARIMTGDARLVARFVQQGQLIRGVTGDKCAGCWFAWSTDRLWVRHAPFQCLNVPDRCCPCSACVLSRPVGNPP